jgi:hypothetical protein
MQPYENTSRRIMRYAVSSWCEVVLYECRLLSAVRTRVEKLLG